jgi:uncharacterized protein
VTSIAVTVVYALPGTATEIAIRLPQSATVADALDRSAIATLHPELDLAHCTVGIFGQRVDRRAAVSEGDRVEIYRPLIADPKESRRKRVKGRKGA